MPRSEGSILIVALIEVGIVFSSLLRGFGIAFFMTGFLLAIFGAGTKKDSLEQIFERRWRLMVQGLGITMLSLIWFFWSRDYDQFVAIYGGIFGIIFLLSSFREPSRLPSSSPNLQQSGPSKLSSEGDDKNDGAS